jgi:hypothetical protein
VKFQPASINVDAVFMSREVFPVAHTLVAAPVEVSQKLVALFAVVHVPPFV